MAARSSMRGVEEGETTGADGLTPGVLLGGVAGGGELGLHLEGGGVAGQAEQQRSPDGPARTAPACPAGCRPGRSPGTGDTCGGRRCATGPAPLPVRKVPNSRPQKLPRAQLCMRKPARIPIRTAVRYNRTARDLRRSDRRRLRRGRSPTAPGARGGDAAGGAGGGDGAAGPHRCAGGAGALDVAARSADAPAGDRRGARRRVGQPVGHRTDGGHPPAGGGDSPAGAPGGGDGHPAARWVPCWRSARGCAWSPRPAWATTAGC